MGYAINSSWTKLRQKDIKKLNAIIDDEYSIELEIGRKLNLMEKFYDEFEAQLKYFDFDAVIKYMHDTNWEWSMYKNGKSFQKIPDKEDIIEFMRDDLLKHALYRILELNESEAGGSGGGVGLNIGVIGGPNGNEVWVHLYFNIA